MSNTNVKDKAVKGGMFLAFSNLLSQISSILLNFILAKLLIPEDFGLFALSNASIGFIASITSIGFGSAIIQKQDATKVQISTLYLINFITSAVTFALVYFSAGYYERFYDANGLAKIIQYSSFSILITPFFITHFKLFEKDLKLNLVSKIVIYSTLLSTLATVAAAYAGWGVYALVVQTVSINLFKLVFTFIYSKYKVGYGFDLKSSLGLIWYAVKYKTGQAIQYFERNVDYLILGKVFNTVVLGYYSFAYNIMYLPVKRISDIFRDILFPTFSKIKDDKPKILQGYFKSVNLVMMVSFPLMLIVSFNTDLLLRFAFGEKWIGASSIVSILAIGGAFQSITQFGDVVFSSIGLPEKTIYLTLSRIAGTVIAIFIGLQFDMEGVALFLTISKIFSFFILLYVINKHIRFTIGSFFNVIKGTSISILCYLLVEGIIHTVDYEYAWAKLIATSLLIFGLVFLTNKTVVLDLIKTIKKK